MRTILADFFNLFYPSLCICCKHRLVNQENFLCIECLNDLPITNHLEIKTNSLEKVFYGRLPLAGIASLGYFTKGGLFQKIIHEIKYKQNQDLATYIGQLCGTKLENSYLIEGIDYIVPVPLHRNRLKKRGYNQALLLAQGIAQKVNTPIIDNNLVRLIDNDSQTTKSITERRDNIDKIFGIQDKSLFEGKHMLIVDDVITTGSTIEVCAKKILDCRNTKVSIFTVCLSV